MPALRAAAGCFGKLPLAADYLRHHRGGSTVLEWERWLEDGVAAASRQLGPGIHEPLRAFPPIRFLHPGRRSETVLVGAAGPGQDRSGRLFPFTAFVDAARDGGDSWSLPAGRAGVLVAASDLVRDPGTSLENLFARVDALGSLDHDPAGDPENEDSPTLGSILGPGGYVDGLVERGLARLAAVAQRVRTDGVLPTYGIGVALPVEPTKAKRALALWLDAMRVAFGGARPSIFWSEDGEHPRFIAYLQAAGPAAFLQWLQPTMSGEDVFRLDTEPDATEPGPARAEPGARLHLLARRVVAMSGEPPRLGGSGRRNREPR